jgi:hypothetical protein
MKLGPLAYMTLYSQQPDATATFCTTLGFRIILSDRDSALLTDGTLYFDVRRSEHSATALSYIGDDIVNKIEMAENLELHVTEKSRHHAIIREPNGLNILLIDEKIIPLKEFSRRPISLCGTFYEVSLETDNIERSIQWWHNVGFKVTAKKETWCTLDDGNINIGLYQRGTCLHKFKNPSLTYFEADMKERIAELKKRNIQLVQDEEDIGMKGHAIAETPDGQYFFLFKS